MADAMIETKSLSVDVQANGLIRRRVDGLLIAKLTDGTKYEDFATENPIPDALAVIVRQLREDKDYYIAWQSNIAMAFQNVLTLAGYRFPELYKLANEAADNFLDNLMRQADAANVA